MPVQIIGFIDCFLEIDSSMPTKEPVGIRYRLLVGNIVITQTSHT